MNKIDHTKEKTEYIINILSQNGNVFINKILNMDERHYYETGKQITNLIYFIGNGKKIYVSPQDKNNIQENKENILSNREHEILIQELNNTQDILNQYSEKVLNNTKYGNVLNMEDVFTDEEVNSDHMQKIRMWQQDRMVQFK